MSRCTRHLLWFSLVWIVLIAIVGCGYTTRSTLDPKYRTIYVPAFQNESRDYDLQAPLTNAIRRKFITDGRLQVADRSNADLILEGTIRDIKLKGLTYDAKDETVQFLCVVIAKVKCTEAATGKTLWEDPAMTGETTFYTRAAGQSSDRLRGNAEAFLSTVRSFSTEEENRGVSEALEQLASDIFYRTIEPW
ncbi:MAG TPA: LptE family protein [Candidatus Hydrogenedentes bacterium]|nr:LptE family protein [Candidatus Hydrogenedentota bacterium]HOL76485.1 LptE family protein [Candidatus Hydrogenedentota bacterium]HPO85149.1 LptE family protein [Candidatus Hydrogenedentota bacterium]